MDSRDFRRFMGKTPAKRRAKYRNALAINPDARYNGGKPAGKRKGSD